MSSRVFPRVVLGIIAVTTTGVPGYAELGKDWMHSTISVLRHRRVCVTVLLRA
jgi:hypothetical protein